MTAYLLDTNHASRAIVDTSPLRQRMAAAAGDTFDLCTPVLGELWFMVFNSGRTSENEQRLHTFLAGFPVLPYDAQAAREYGQVRSQLRRLGRPIPQIDIQIASIARCLGLVLLTSDRHFDVVPGLRTENWTP